MTEREVVVDGDVVRRPRKPWTLTVHSLLRHLHDQGLPVPEPLDTDEHFEFVRLVPGDGGDAAWPHQTTTAAVASAGALLRRVHDLFDWDVARPAEPVSDVAYALEWLAPFDDDVQQLRRRGLRPDVDRRGRIGAFLDGYRWDGAFDVVDAVLARQQRAIDEVVWLGRAGHEPQRSWVAAGWPDRWSEKLVVTERLRERVS
ncbi:phosphotransferase family enzyme [Curtobacterium sp. PhB130]|uniref:phosphotransferase n=1 Tax=Curtobacterium sp. PhB130 TaxID=2485178 RepID=UPI000F4CE700|nr:phosphotransferase [Curtobacterium sp. PhB130]ROS72299.1 phosphotransferase family enzyme [Curtobacterium sp. PhB130]